MKRHKFHTKMIGQLNARQDVLQIEYFFKNIIKF